MHVHIRVEAGVIQSGWISMHCLTLYHVEWMAEGLGSLKVKRQGTRSSTHVVQTNVYGSMITFTQSVDDVFIGNVQVKYRR